MNQAIYLDPSSLSLWFDPSYFADNPQVQRGLHHAIMQDWDEIRALPNRFKGDDDWARCLHLVSSVWHEYRHFADLIITNFGAFRVRQFFALYVNQGLILSQAVRKGSRVVFPFDNFSDPVRCAQLGVDPWSEEAKTVAKMIRERTASANFDHTVINAGQHSFSVSGDAQLEAMAYLSQLSAVQEHFGLDAARLFQEDLGEDRRSNLTYRWAEVLADRMGLLPRLPKNDIGQTYSDVEVVDITLLGCLIFASLMCRRWPGYSGDDPTASGMPSLRLVQLLTRLHGQFPVAGDLHTSEAWDLVDNACKELWGRTIVEELEADYWQEENYLAQIIGEDHVLPYVQEAIQDFHRLRDELIAIFRKNPAAFVDPTTFSRELLPRLHPLPVCVAQDGVLGVPPPGWSRAFGYSEPGDTSPEATWWWAAYLTSWSTRKDLLSMRDSQSWHSIIETSGPLAKLMFNGRRHRTMLGPEFLLVESQLEQMGVRFVFDPTYEFPREDDDIKLLRLMTGREQLVCDFCKAKFDEPEGHTLSGWVFRRSLRNAEIAVRLHGEGKKGYLRSLRDWSMWVLCDSCYDAARPVLLAP